AGQNFFHGFAFEFVGRLVRVVQRLAKSIQQPHFMPTFFFHAVEQDLEGLARRQVRLFVDVVFRDEHDRRLVDVVEQADFATSALEAGVRSGSAGGTLRWHPKSGRDQDQCGTGRSKGNATFHGDRVPFFKKAGAAKSQNGANKARKTILEYWINVSNI